ncbi:MAG: indolepyruvate ferredoxin oxidoreductase family protein [Ilumatobacteraceae bacterium]
MAVIDTAVGDYVLDDRYRLDDGRVFASGSQALARLPYEQLRVDARAGLRTAAYVTGYPGSPLANFDRDVSAAAALAQRDGLPLVFQPAMNEELGATAVMGSQLAVTLDSCRYDGVLGIWYGKAPGIDRASDALRHAAFAGTSQYGGAVALVGDDPTAKSSTLPSSTGATLVDLNMPIIHPGDVQEAIDLGRHAVALSRASGLWVGVKIVETVADGSGTIEVHPDRITPVVPTVEVDGRVWVPMPSGRLLTPYSLDMEREFHAVRLDIARRYGVANRLNEVVVRGASDWIGIIASGHTYHETREALSVLGLRTDDQLRDVGIRVFKVGMPMPLDPEQVRDFATGLSEIVVVEEKTPNLEWYVKDALFGRPAHALVTGKRTPDDQPCFPTWGGLDADAIAPLLRSRLEPRLASRLAPPPPARRQLIPLSVNRSPYFCSGCPHNSSTKVPEDSLIGGGIGCHSMVMLMEPDQVGHIIGLTSMGNEGAQWFGMAPFVDEPHLIQNLGDGTLFHSGMGAIRAAIANGANITYKILYNGAVSMTGGQDPFGQLDVPRLCKVLLAEGVQRVIVTTDEVSRYHLDEMPVGVKVWDRSRLIEAQEVLAVIEGCTVLIHDQRCAAEKRRDRKRGRIPAPTERVVIDERVCEGCGDCGAVSNCLSVQPVDTPWGRKTRIDQGSCNLDHSCMLGDCPSFMTVSVSNAERFVPVEPPTDLPLPAAPMRDCAVRLSGIGGTGVVTLNQILGTAAMLQGYHVRGLDQTGLSQKAGPVVSDLRLTVGAPSDSNKATTGAADVLLALDQLVAGSENTLRAADASRTTVVVNTAEVPTGSMVVHPDRPFPSADVAGRLGAHARSTVQLDARRLAVAFLGDDSTTNVIVAGVAVQLGVVPVDATLVEQAISLNGVAVAKNLAAFRWGRAWAADCTAVEAACDRAEGTPAVDDRPLRERLRTDLADYASRRYAARFDRTVDTVAALGDDRLTEAVMRNLHKLMAYKDEYEVARLYLLPESRHRAERVGGRRTAVTYHLHPPVLRALGMQRKIALRTGARTMFRVLRLMRPLRGTMFDPFAYARLRRLERALIGEYEQAIDAVVSRLAGGDRTTAAVDEAISIASLPDRVRGYESLKLERALAYRDELAQRTAAFVG